MPSEMHFNLDWEHVHREIVQSREYAVDPPLLLVEHQLPHRHLCLVPSDKALSAACL